MFAENRKLSIRSSRLLDQLVRQLKADAFPLTSEASREIDMAANALADHVLSLMPLSETESSQVSEELITRINLLSNLPLFADSEPQDISVIAERLIEVQAPPQTTLFTQDLPAEGVFFIKSGQVEIIINGELVAQRGAGASVGEMSCLRSEPNASATVRTLTQCTLWKIERQNFLQAVNSLPELWRKVFYDMTDRFQETSLRKSELLQHSTEGLLKIDPKGRITEEYSTKCVDLFGFYELSGKSAGLLIFQNQSQQNLFSQTLPLFFESHRVDFDSLADLLPKEVTFHHPKGGTRYYQLSFYPCWNLYRDLTHIDIGIKDITLETELAQRRKGLEQEKASLQKLYDDPDAFLQLLQLGLDLKSRLNILELNSPERHQGPLIQASLLRQLHTLKGTAAMFLLSGLEKACHDLEDCLSPLQHAGFTAFSMTHFFSLKEDFIKALQLAQGLLNNLSEELKRRLTGVVISPEDFEKFKQLVQKEGNENLLQLLGQIQSQPARRLFRSWPDEIDRLAERLGKKAKLIISGDVVQIPQPLFQALDPVLIHLLRNAMDHGLESPAERLQIGKEEFGRIRIQIQDGNQKLHLQIIDDGRGIDFDKVQAKALEKGVSAAKIQELAQAGETWRLLLEEGISTKAEASEVSGRGLGLNALAELAHQWGGHMEIESSQGQGTRFSLELPLGI